MLKIVEPISNQCCLAKTDVIWLNWSLNSILNIKNWVICYLLFYFYFSSHALYFLLSSLPWALTATAASTSRIVGTSATGHQVLAGYSDYSKRPKSEHVRTLTVLL